MRYANSKIHLKSFSLFHVIIALFAMLLVVPTVFFSTEVEAANKNTVNSVSASSAYVGEDAAPSQTVEADSNETENVIALQRAIVIDEAKKETEIEIEKIEKEKEQKEEKKEKKKTEEQTVEVAAPVVEASKPQQETQREEPRENPVQNVVTPAASSGAYLLDIENPDPNYCPSAVSLSPSDRDLVERIVMGETGYAGYTSMALVAQCLRDAYLKGNYTSVSQLKSDYGYCGVTSITPSQSCKDAVSFIFDQGGSAVQHRILVYYATNYCQSDWHESQNFVCQVNYQRFFDF